MFNKISKKVKFSDKLPDRARRQEILRQVLLCQIYDNMDHPFYKEKNEQDQTISIYDRAPIVDLGLGLIKNTVDTTISFVFGEGRFPDIDCIDDDLRVTLLDLIKETNLFQIMQEAMLWGSMGSVAIFIFVSESNRIHFKVFQTQYLTPQWSKLEPDQLDSITEKYIVTGLELQQRGYKIESPSLTEQFWFMRIWDNKNETWFFPWPVNQEPNAPPPQIDKDRSVVHNLGFVPFVWIMNLKGGDDIDGMSTFANAIKACIEIDYLISQGDRGLKYMADPMLVIVDPADTSSPIFRNAASALILGKEGKAEILEMSGNGYNALLDQVKQLRDSALETMSGNRSTPEKMTAAQSGAALAQLWTPTVMLAGDLRNSYGEKGLLQLLKLVVKIGSSRRLKINDKVVAPLTSKETIALRWAPYFEPTLFDLQMQASTLVTLRTGGLLSQTTAIKILSNEYAIEDCDAELALIKAEQDEQDQREIKLAAATTVTAKQN